MTQLLTTDAHRMFSAAFVCVDAQLLPLSCRKQVLEAEALCPHPLTQSRPLSLLSFLSTPPPSSHRVDDFSSIVASLPNSPYTQPRHYLMHPLNSLTFALAPEPARHGCLLPRRLERRRQPPHCGLLAPLHLPPSSLLFWLPCFSMMLIGSSFFSRSHRI